jgi:hypothetical protein
MEKYKKLIDSNDHDKLSVEWIIDGCNRTTGKEIVKYAKETSKHISAIQIQSAMNCETIRDILNFINSDKFSCDKKKNIDVNKIDNDIRTAVQNDDLTEILEIWKMTNFDISVGFKLFSCGVSQWNYPFSIISTAIGMKIIKTAKTTVKK